MTAKFPLWILVGAVLGGLTVGLWAEGRRREDLGRWKAERETLERAIVALGKVQREADSVLVVDSTAFRAYANRYYRLRDSLRADSTPSRGIPGTLISDSVLVRLRPETLLSVCDSTVTLAEKALASCAARVRAGDSLLAATQARLKHETKKPGARRFPVLTLGAFVTPEGTVKLGIGVGLRIF